MSWLPRKVGSAVAEESGVVYMSSPAKRACSCAAEPPFAYEVAFDWNVKSSTEFMSVLRTYGESLAGSASYTSPNMKKSGLPAACA